MMRRTDIADSALLSDRVYTILRNDIVLCRMQPGEKINLLKLGGQMNVSGAPIREAINLLAKDGLVTINPRRQPEVSLINTDDYQAIIHMRQMIEPYAARLSANRIPEEELKATRQIIHNVLATPDDEDLNLEAHMALHRCIYGGTTCALLADTCMRLKLHASRLHHYALLQFPMTPECRRRRVIDASEEHLRILDVLEEGDPDRVELAARQHIQKYIDEIDKCLRLSAEYKPKRDQLF